MRTLVLVFATVVTLLIASSASARVLVEYKDYPTDNTNPTVRTCEAYSWMGQKCRECRTIFDTNGNPTGFTCVQMTSDAFCTCGDSGKPCAPKGLCKYR